jgi:hypothetical protein
MTSTNKLKKLISGIIKLLGEKKNLVLGLKLQ